MTNTGSRKLDLAEIKTYVKDNIGNFHTSRIENLKKIDLKEVLERKNPYLFKAKYVVSPEQIVRSILDARLSSTEESIFGNWLEGLAIFVNQKAFGGHKSGIQGIDLEFDKEDKRCIVSIKSGPNWGNSSQIRQMRSDFKAASKALRSSNSKLNVVAVNGCCYGKSAKQDKGDYFKFCGQKFWEFISSENNLFIEIVKPLGHYAKRNNTIFAKSYSDIVNQFTEEFAQGYCKPNGDIDWDKLVRLSSEDYDSKKNK